MPGEVAARCPNPDCPAQLKRRVQHFASTACLGIEGLGPTLIDALVESGGSKPCLTSTVGAGRDLARAQGAPATKPPTPSPPLRMPMRRTVALHLWPRLAGVGAVSARTPARKFRLFDTLADAIADFASVLDTSAASAVSDHSQIGNRAVIADLISACNPLPPAAASAIFAGKTFVLTGTLPHLTRAQAEEITAPAAESGSVGVR